MNVTLAVDSVSTVGGGVLIDDGQDVHAYRTIEPLSHAATLVPTILDLLREHSLTLDAVTKVVVADGPGSFTGIRIGLASAWGIVSGGRDVELLVAPAMAALSMDAMHHLKCDRAICLFDAYRGDVFAAEYAIDGGTFQEVAPPHIVPLADVELDERVELIVGDVVPDGLSTYSEAKAWQDVATSPGGLVRLAALGFAKRVPDLSRFEPNYGRLAEAQVKWEAEHGRRFPDS